MKITDRTCLQGKITEYPIWGMVLATALLMVSPFVSGLIPYAVFLICVYRLIRYDAKVFATDYCLLMPASALFRTTGGMSLLIWLCLAAAIWYFVRGKIRGNSALVLLLLLLSYLILRMQMNINDYVLCFGQIFIMFVLLPEQDSESAERSIKVFCWSLAVSSVYALLFRNTHYIGNLVGYEGEAIWGTGITRFQGLNKDPNYYMTQVIVVLALLCKLKEAGRLRPAIFWILGGIMTVFGILTYSKAFFLVFILLVGTYIIWQFWNKKLFRGMVFSAVGVAAVLYVLYSENSPFAVVLERFITSENLSDLTTGRSDLYIAYWNAITQDVGSFLFGQGLNAPLLSKGAHNLYLEIMYYTGVVGLGLIVGFYGAMFRWIGRRVPEFRKQGAISKYVVLLMVLVVYCSLQGMFQMVCYAMFFLAYLSLYITKKDTE